MTTLSIAYGTNAAITCTTTALASDTNLLAGRQSNIVDNTTTKAVSYLLGGTIATSGTPTASTQIQVYLFGSWDGSTFTNGLSGAGDANATLVSGTPGLMPLAQQITQPDTTARTYTIGPIDVAAAFGGTMPEKWGFWIVQNTGATLGATALTATPINYTNA